MRTRSCRAGRLTVRWQVDGASSFALRVDGTRQDLLAGDATQTTLTLDTPGQHTLVLVAFQGEHSTEAMLQVLVEEALRIRRFAADPSVLTRHIAGEVTFMWDVVGAEAVRLDDLGALGGQIEAGLAAAAGVQHPDASSGGTDRDPPGRDLGQRPDAGAVDLAACTGPAVHRERGAGPAVCRSGRKRGAGMADGGRVPRAGQPHGGQRLAARARARW